jgi:hypothetical protein
LDESIDRYLGITEREEPSIEEFEFCRTVELTGHREVPRMTGVVGIDEQTCPFEELRTRQLLLRTRSEAPGLRRSNCRIPSGNQMTVSDCKALPIRSLLIEAAHTFEFILDEERHNMGQLYSFLFTIGKAGHAFAFHQWLAVVRSRGETQHGNGEQPRPACGDCRKTRSVQWSRGCRQDPTWGHDRPRRKWCRNLPISYPQV